MVTKTWQGGDSYWTFINDWSPSGQPGAGDAVTIASGVPIIQENDGAIGSLEITGAVNQAGLVIASGDPRSGYSTGASLTVSNDLINDGSIGIDGSEDMGGSALGAKEIDNSGGFLVGNGVPYASTIVTVGGGGFINAASGIIQLTSDSTTDAVIVNVGTTAGFNNGVTTGQITGTVTLQGDAQIDFSSGAIDTVAKGALLTLSGALAAINAGSGTMNSALVGLTSIAGGIIVEAGAAVNTGSGADIANTFIVGTDLVVSGVLAAPEFEIESGGTLELSSTGAIGQPNIGGLPQLTVTFQPGATYRIDATPFNGEHYSIPFVDFGLNTTLDLAGMTFATGATAVYDSGSSSLTVTSNGVVEYFTVQSATTTQFQAVKEQNGMGTVVEAGPPSVTIVSANLAHGAVGLSGSIDVADATKTIDLYNGMTFLGVADANASGAWAAEFTFSASGVYVLTAQATNAAGTGVSNKVIDLVSASTTLSSGGQIVVFSGAGDIANLTGAGDTIVGFAAGDKINLNGFGAYLPIVPGAPYPASFILSTNGDVVTQANSDGTKEVTTYDIAGQSFTAKALLSNAEGQIVAKYYQGVTGEGSLTSFEYLYAGNNLAATDDFYAGIAGQAYTSEEVDYDGAGRATRAAFSGVSSAPYSAYEYDYVGGVFEGSRFTYTKLPAGASYSSYEVDSNRADAFVGEKFFFTDVTGQSYTGEEEDFDANDKLARVLLTGIASQAYSSLEEDYNAGTYAGYKAYYTRIAGTSYTNEEVDVSSSNQIQRVVYSGMTSTPYSSVEQDYANGSPSTTIYGYDDVTGQTYNAYQVEENAQGSALQETFDLNSGGHSLIALTAGQTLTSLGDDKMTGSSTGTTNFVFDAVYGADTITNLTSADKVSLPTSEFASFSAMMKDAANVGGNVAITAADGDTLTLKNLMTGTLATMSASFSFHA